MMGLFNEVTSEMQVNRVDMVLSFGPWKDRNPI